MPIKTAQKARKRPSVKARRKTPRKAPTRRQLQAAGLVAAGVAMATALREAGFTESTAVHQPPNQVTPIREIAQAEMRRQGVSCAAVVERLRAKLYACTLKNIKVVHKSKSGLPVTLDETVTVEDHGAQLDALRQARAVLGIDAPKETKVEVSGSVAIEERRKEQRAMWASLGGID